MSHVPAPPPGAAVVFVGEEVEFQRETKSVKDQAKHGRKTESNSVKCERVWTVTKTAEIRSCTCCGECKTEEGYPLPEEGYPLPAVNDANNGSLVIRPI